MYSYGRFRYLDGVIQDVKLDVVLRDSTLSLDPRARGSSLAAPSKRDAASLFPSHPISMHLSERRETFFTANGAALRPAYLHILHAVKISRYRASQ